ncbi:MAG: phage tail assembly protein [Pseudolysinimonas sp.]
MSAKTDPVGNLDDDLVIDLKKPIDGPAGPVTQIVLREPTAGEIMQWDKLSGAEADAAAISIVGGIPKSVVEKMPARSFYQAARYVGSFLA